MAITSSVFGSNAAIYYFTHVTIEAGKWWKRLLSIFPCVAAAYENQS